MTYLILGLILDSEQSGRLIDNTFIFLDSERSVWCINFKRDVFFSFLLLWKQFFGLYRIIPKFT